MIDVEVPDDVALDRRLGFVFSSPKPVMAGAVVLIWAGALVTGIGGELGNRLEVLGPAEGIDEFGSIFIFWLAKFASTTSGGTFSTLIKVDKGLFCIGDAGFLFCIPRFGQ